MTLCGGGRCEFIRNVDAASLVSSISLSDAVLSVKWSNSGCGSSCIPL